MCILCLGPEKDLTMRLLLVERSCGLEQVAAADDSNEFSCDGIVHHGEPLEPSGGEPERQRQKSALVKRRIATAEGVDDGAQSLRRETVPPSGRC
jgi:hypothetical protein